MSFLKLVQPLSLSVHSLCTTKLIMYLQCCLYQFLSGVTGIIIQVWSIFITISTFTSVHPSVFPYGVHHTSSFFHVCSFRCLIRPLLQLGYPGEAGSPSVQDIKFSLKYIHWSWRKDDIYIVLTYFRGGRVEWERWSFAHPVCVEVDFVVYVNVV